MDSSEYFCETINESKLEDEISSKCDEYAQEGWKLVSHTIADEDNHFLTFARQPNI